MGMTPEVGFPGGQIFPTGGIHIPEPRRGALLPHNIRHADKTDDEGSPKRFKLDTRDMKPLSKTRESVRSPCSPPPNVQHGKYM